MRIDWFKEGSPLVPSGGSLVQPAGAAAEEPARQQQSKYSEIAYFYAANSSEQQPRQRLSNLAVQQHQQVAANHSLSGASGLSARDALRSSELFINYADRGDTGTFVCLARNAYGKDELTYRLIVQEAPDVPYNLNAQNIQATSLRLSWTLPFDGNLPLTHSIIEHRKLHPSDSRGFSLQPEAGRSSEWSRLVVGASKLDNEESANNSTLQSQSVVLRQLSARCTYQLRVAAANAIGQGAFSAPLTVTTAEEPPTSRPQDLRAQPVSSSSIKVLWRGPAQVEEQAPIKGYYVSHRRAQAGAKEESSGNQVWLATASVSAANVSFGAQAYATRSQQPVSSYELQLAALEKNTKYEIRVQPFNSVGVGPASETIGQTLKFDRPSQPNLRLVSARKQSIELRWSLSDEQPLMGFSLFYKCEYDDWQEIQLGAIFHYVIENLRCGNKYQIYLSAFNVVGRSEPSDVLNVRTEGTVPIAPEKSQFFRSNTTEVVLDMSGWQSGGCPISSFMIQFKRLHESNWFILSEGATPFASANKITIPDLAPGTWYKLLVTALNEAGSTNAEYLFSTLTLDGQPAAPTFAGEHEASPVGGGGGARATASSMLSGLGQFLFARPAGHGNEAQLLLPLSCILLLVVTSFASYLYYSRASAASQWNRSQQATNPDGSSASQRQQQQQQQAQRSFGRSPSRLVDQIESCNLAASRGLLDEKQLVHSANGHQLSHLMSSSTLPLDGAHLGQANSSQQNSVLDSFLASTPLQSFVGAGARNQRAHGLRLLSSGSLFAGNQAYHPANQANAAPSSVSTNSTTCPDGSSSSSCASAAGGAKAKLQLINESAMISSAIDESLDEGSRLLQQQQQPFQQHQLLYEDAPASPGRPLYSGLRSEHVDIVNPPLELGEQAAGQQLMVEASLAQCQEQQQQQHAYQNRLYAHLNQRLLSSSFTTAADLLQRQQQQQSVQLYYQQPQPAEEPIYQRLEKFQAYSLPGHKQQQFSTAGQANFQTLRTRPAANLIGAAQEPMKSTTLDRTHQQRLPPAPDEHFLAAFSADQWKCSGQFGCQEECDLVQQQQQQQQLGQSTCDQNERQNC